MGFDLLAIPRWILTAAGVIAPTNNENVRVPRLEVDNATTYIDKDGANNLTLTDAVTGTKTLAELLVGGAGDMTKAVYDPDTDGVIAAAQLDTTLVLTGGTRAFTGDQEWLDNVAAIFGTGSDASIFYDGTNLVVNPKLVGTGYLSVLGNIGIGANLITTTNLSIKEASAITIGIYASDGTTRRNLLYQDLEHWGVLAVQSITASIRGFWGAGDSLAFEAWDTDGAGSFVDIANIIGAADPYWQFTLPLRFNPIATASLPATPVEGMMTYDATLDKLTYRDADSWEVVVNHTTFDTHTARHAVGGADTVFPADPGADRFLMWDDDPGVLVWTAIAGGGDMLKATYDPNDDGVIAVAQLDYAGVLDNVICYEGWTVVHDGELLYT